MLEEQKSQEGFPKLRRFQKKDEEAVYKLHLAALKHEGIDMDNPQSREWFQDLGNIEEVYINNKGEFLVAAIGDEVVGMGALKKVDETTGQIKRMRVKFELWNKGMGKMILDGLMKRAKELGYKKLILDTTVTQKAAQHLYESRGFKEYKKGIEDGHDTIYYQREI